MIKKLFTIIRKKNSLHTFDYLVMVALAAVIGVLLYVRLTRKTEWVNVVVRIQPDSVWWAADPEPWHTSSFNLHDAAYNSFGQKTAEITDIITIETTKGKVDTLIELRLKASVGKNKQYVYNYQPLLIGKPIEIPFQTTAVSGIVLHTNTPLTMVDKQIEIRLLAEFPWTTERLTAGLKAYDSRGRVIGEILRAESHNALSYEFTEKNGRRFFFPSEDPNRKDATIVLRVKAVKYNGLYYSLSGSPLKVGNEFQMQFPDVAINWSIISNVDN